MSYNLFLDDYRKPSHAVFCPILDEHGQYFGSTSDLYTTRVWTIVKSVDEFKQTVCKYGLPELISFDHDLSEEHYGGTVNDKTGKEAARWLVEEYMQKEARGRAMPKWFVHSMNPSGAMNIASYLMNATAHGLVHPRCDMAPSGWWCKRLKGHGGPCAAIPINANLIPK